MPARQEGSRAGMPPFFALKSRIMFAMSACASMQAAPSHGLATDRPGLRLAIADSNGQSDNNTLADAIFQIDKDLQHGEVTTMAMNCLRTASVAVSMLAPAFVGGVSTAQAADFKLNYGLLTVNDTQHYFANAVKDAVEKATKGRVEVEVFPRSQLGSPSAHVQGLQLGTIAAFQAPIDFFAGVDPRAGVFSIPFMFKSRLQTTRSVQDPAIFDEAMTLLEGNGIVGVMIGSQADGKYIARKPLQTLADFNGKKMRVNATDAERERMKRLGATAIPMGLAEMVTSLQSGVIDGTMSGISIHVNFNLHTISKVLLVTNDTMLVSYAALSKKWLDTLPADLRKTLVDTIRDMKPTLSKLSDQEDADLTQKWLDRGGSFIKWSDADMAEFHKRVGSVGQDVTAKNAALNAYFKKVKAVSDKHK